MFFVNSRNGFLVATGVSCNCFSFSHLLKLKQVLVLYFTCRYYPKFLRSSILCKFQLEYISSGKLKLLDFILGDNTLFYFMEVSFMITSSNIWYKFSQLSNYSLKHWLLIVHHAVRLFTALITSLVMNVCLRSLDSIWSERMHPPYSSSGWQLRILLHSCPILAIHLTSKQIWLMQLLFMKGTSQYRNFAQTHNWHLPNCIWDG